MQNHFHHRWLLAASVVCAALLGACADTPPASQSNLSVTQTERGVLIRSQDKILFAIGKADLQPQAHQYLDEVVKLLNSEASRNVLIEGHTDNTGGAALNKELSEQRAQAVRQALVERGVDKTRITARGLGETMPIASNATADGRQANRRTDITILGARTEDLLK
ncbi:MAG: OmpA family protein [Burkholderiaceae bacterium]|jgi:outer membrane protein OmpA-like peptidoglycan-associated protein|nr:OmpA family protein [Burkholderiaceae bacterium]